MGGEPRCCYAAEKEKHAGMGGEKKRKRNDQRMERGHMYGRKRGEKSVLRCSRKMGK